MRISTKSKDCLLLGSILALSCFLFRETFFFDVSIGAAASSYGPEFFPRILLGLIIVLCLTLTVQCLKQKQSGENTAEKHGQALLRVGGVALSCVLCALLWEILGFLWATGIFALLLCVLLRPTMRCIAVIALFIPLVWYFFAHVFMVSL